MRFRERISCEPYRGWRMELNPNSCGMEFALRRWKVADGKPDRPTTWIPASALVAMAVEILRPYIGDVLMDAALERGGVRPLEMEREEVSP